MYCMLCGEDIYPQTHYGYIDTNNNNIRRYTYTCSLCCATYTHVQWMALGCSETGKTWVTPANPHSQTGLAQNAERLSGPSRSIPTREVRAIFVWNLVTTGKCVHLAVGPQMICSVLTTGLSLGLFRAMSPGCVHVKFDCMCVSWVWQVLRCRLYMVSVCDSRLGVTTFFFFVIKVT